MTPERQLARVVPVEFGGSLNGLLRQLGSAWSLVAFEAATEAGRAGAAANREDLARRLADFQQKVLRDHELPAIHRAALHASHNETRELIGLARSLRPSVPTSMAEASLRVGASQLQRLRPLRDHRVVQRFLDAVEGGQAEPWHPVVFGLTLAVFSLPVLQGMTVYERQSLASFLEAAARPLALFDAERRALIESLPSAVASFAGDLHAADPRLETVPPR
jgi:urease accessory protein UreF